MTDIELRESLAHSTTVRRLLQNLGYFGHFLHVHAGGRSGKQHILTAIYQNGGNIAQSELAKQSCVSTASLSEVIAKLEAGGFISRVRSATDGRQLDIQLTPAGTDKARELVAAKLAFENEAFVPQRAESGLQGWIACFGKSALKGHIFCGGVGAPNEIVGNTKLQEAFEMGKNI